MKCFERLTTDRNYAIGWGVLSFSVIAFFLSILLIVGTVMTIGQYRQLDDTYNTITVEGYAEVTAVPDVAVFSFSVTEEADTVEIAQQNSAEKINAIFDYLKQSDIDTDKDVKTTSYNTYPRYEWVRSCYSFDCPPGENKLIGYEVSQTISVKVRETDTAGTILTGVGSRGATNISGLSFEIDDPTQLKEDARNEAVRDAKAKAKVLANELGVSLKDLVGFYENTGGYPYPMAYEERAVMSMDAAMGGAKAPELPAGENTITSSVSITYKIK